MDQNALLDNFYSERTKALTRREQLILELPDGSDPWLWDENHRLVRASDLAKRYRAEEIHKQAWRGGKRRRR